jgi:hypothetical protein
MGQLNAYKRRNTAIITISNGVVGTQESLVAEQTQTGLVQDNTGQPFDIVSPSPDLPNGLRSPGSNSSQHGISINNTMMEAVEPTLPKLDTFLLICQIKAFDEAKINKFVSSQSDMIVDFDFYTAQDRFNMVSWSRDQHLRVHSMDLLQIAPPSRARNGEDVLGEAPLMPTASLTTATGARHMLPSNTPNSSRKSSFSEFNYGTPPAAAEMQPMRSYAAPTVNVDENGQIDDIMTCTSVSISIPHTMLRSNHDFLKKHPKCFGAKFTNLPEQFLIFANDGYDHNLIQNAKNAKFGNLFFFTV